MAKRVGICINWDGRSMILPLFAVGRQLCWIGRDWLDG